MLRRSGRSGTGKRSASTSASGRGGLWGEGRNPSDHGVAQMASLGKGIAGRGADDLPPAIRAFLVSRESGLVGCFSGRAAPLCGSRGPRGFGGKKRSPASQCVSDAHTSRSALYTASFPFPFLSLLFPSTFLFLIATFKYLCLIQRLFLLLYIVTI